jgi:hypothetical protein
VVGGTAGATVVEAGVVGVTGVGTIGVGVIAGGIAGGMGAGAGVVGAGFEATGEMLKTGRLDALSGEPQAAKPSADRVATATAGRLMIMRIGPTKGGKFTGAQLLTSGPIILRAFEG